MQSTAEQLTYQRVRPLGDVPRYTAGLQFQLKDGERVYVALSELELAVYFQHDLALHYDLEGRLTRIARPDYYRRLGLSNRAVATRKRTAAEKGGIARQALSPEQAGDMVREAHQAMSRVWEHLNTGTGPIEYAKPGPGEALATVTPLLKRAANFDGAAAQKNSEQFHSIYGRVAVLPPDQYNALVLQATEGCAYSCCLFCELYRGVFYGRKTAAQFQRHLRAAVEYHGKALRSRRSIFLGEANALTLPQPELVEIFGVLREHFEFAPHTDKHVPSAWWLGHAHRFDGVSTFLDAFTGPHRTTDEFVALRELGLRRVYLGLESGDDDLLKWLCKPARRASIQRCVRQLKESGLAVGVVVLLGAGGREFAEAHARETTQLLNELPLGHDDFIYFSPLVIYQGSRYAEQTKALQIAPLTAMEVDRQEQAIRDGLVFDSQRGRPKIGRYELEYFVY